MLFQNSKLQSSVMISTKFLTLTFNGPVLTTEVTSCLMNHYYQKLIDIHAEGAVAAYVILYWSGWIVEIH
jgi:hypothetical protein